MRKRHTPDTFNGMPIVDAASVEIVELVEGEFVSEGTPGIQSSAPGSDIELAGASLYGIPATFHPDGSVSVPLNAGRGSSHKPVVLHAELDVNEPNNSFTLLATGNTEGAHYLSSIMSPQQPSPSQSASHYYAEQIPTPERQYPGYLPATADMPERAGPQDLAADRDGFDIKGRGKKAFDGYIERKRKKRKSILAKYATRYALIFSGAMIATTEVLLPIATDVFGDPVYFINPMALPNVGKAFEGPIDILEIVFNRGDE